uniref:Uncharacterized protein n=1 Tax=Oryza glumipatula TaxID=40148 RepID=A0A0E0AKR1_9ORYZ
MRYPFAAGWQAMAAVGDYISKGDFQFTKEAIRRRKVTRKNTTEAVKKLRKKTEGFDSLILLWFNCLGDFVGVIYD